MNIRRHTYVKNIRYALVLEASLARAREQNEHAKFHTSGCEVITL